MKKGLRIFNAIYKYYKKENDFFYKKKKLETFNLIMKKRLLTYKDNIYRYMC